MQNQNIKAVIFDLDGVLCTTDKYHYQAWKEVSQKFNLDFDWQLNHKLRGISRMDCVDIILEANKKTMTKEEKQNYAEQKNNLYIKLLSNLSEKDLNEGAKNLLDTLKKRKYLLAVGSSSKNTKLILKKTGIIDIFDAISDGNNIQKSKPDPEVFLKAAQYLNTDKKSCIVVEDAESGIKAAKNAKMLTIAIGEAKKSKICDYKIQNLTEILEILK